MAYPSFEQYNNAFTAHQQLLADPELRNGTVARTGLGTPLAISGGFALTYTITTNQGKYAVRCFHRKSKALERRYQAIAKRLAQLNSQYFLKFDFQPRGIRVDGHAYPIVKMAWAPGVTLGEFLESNYGRKGALASLPSSLLALSRFLEDEHVAHGDLSPGNVMVSGSGAVQLIDYDGMFVEDIRDLGSSELGNINFQHPERKAKNPFNSKLDRFSLIALSIAIKGLNEDPALWDITKSDVDAIVFRANDFIDPSSSLAFSQLSRLPSLARHAQNFATVCRAPLEKAPSLEDFFSGRNIPAGTVQIPVNVPHGRSKPRYLSVYEVLNANDYEQCLRHVGDKVEVIGRIVEVKQDKARNGKPYVFINFGPWLGKIFKIAIWSEGLSAISNRPDSSWAGKWISVIGLMEPPYSNKRYKYSHLSINVTTNGQMTVISEAEAKFRLTPPPISSTATTMSNREALERIKGRPSVPQANTARAATVSPNKNILDSIRKSQGAGQLRPIQVQAPPSRQQQRAPVSRQQPEAQGLLRKIVSWIFK